LFQCDTERLLLSVGGRQRSDSVRNGLEDLSDELEIVVIHDAARPFATMPMFDSVVGEARNGNGAAPGLTVVDTLKSVGDDGTVLQTVDRSGLVRIQTPQAFPRAMIERAHAEAKRDNVHATDDAALCERIGLRVIVVPGSERAMKVTTDADFARAEALSILVE
jgi:2-C-methyl-D-erythritol 4-phosphate cytidylyltransferase